MARTREERDGGGGGVGGRTIGFLEDWMCVATGSTARAKNQINNCFKGGWTKGGKGKGVRKTLRIGEKEGGLLQKGGSGNSWGNA